MNLNIYKKIICINILTSMVKDHEYSSWLYINILVRDAQ